jgi:hypothetical protein
MLKMSEIKKLRETMALREVTNRGLRKTAF